MEHDSNHKTENMDYFLYNGPIYRGAVLPFMEEISKSKSSDCFTLILTTNGGDPDAAFKMARHIQSLYSSFTVCLAGMCKSAGTLLATGSSELAFSPYGELGPLDIQLSKRDDIVGQESGLNITEAFFSLSESAVGTYSDIVSEILRMSNGGLSFQTASHSAAEIVTGLFSSVYKQIEPDEVGSRARAMRIGQEYARRLNEKYRNVLPSEEIRLCQFYPSHSFVIDMTEAKNLFKNVRQVNEMESKIVEVIGEMARHQQQSLAIEPLNDIVERIKSGAIKHEQPSENTPRAGGGGSGKRPRKTE